jgi:hypothetical protein
MSTAAIAAIVIVAVIVLAVVLAGIIRQIRRQQLRQRFGLEYDRLVEDRQSRRVAEAELLMRQRHVGELGIRPLDPALRDRYAAGWASAQEMFVDRPDAAVAKARQLVDAVLRDRGYPLTHLEQVISDLSVNYAHTLDHFRAAADISERTETGAVPTEDMRQAMIHYREIFTELLGLTDSAV